MGTPDNRPWCLRASTRGLGGWARTLVLACLALAVPSPGHGAALPELRIYNWEFFLDPEVLAEFGRRHGVKVRQSYFDSDWERDLRLAAGSRADFDIAMVDAAQVAVYRDRGWIVPLGVARVPALANFDLAWRNVNDATASHALPFAWGTLGIAYRADLVKEPPASWAALFRPAANVCGKILVGDDPRELIAIALKATGHSANAVDPEAYRDAEHLLIEQRKCVAGYHYTGVAADTDLPTGKAWAAMAYSSDAAWLRALNPNIRFIVPREGGLIWADYLVVLSSSRQKALAIALLAFISEPAISARLALYNKAGTPNTRARDLLPAAIRQDASIYPSSTALRASELVGELPPAVVSLRNQIFARIIRPK
jgi:spermidine/putrescine transport system substrate-binding protein